MKKEEPKEEPKKIVKRLSRFSNPQTTGQPIGTSKIANPPNVGFRPEALELQARREVKRNG